MILSNKTFLICHNIFEPKNIKAVIVTLILMIVYYLFIQLSKFTQQSKWIPINVLVCFLWVI